jgi:hypothetical protein
MGHTEICNYSDDPNLVLKYLPGDTIGENSMWAANGDIWSHSSDIINGESYAGKWGFGIGYLGFRIRDEFDTIVGWCRIQSYNENYIDFLDYAYYSRHTSVNEAPLNQPEFNYNSLVRDDLRITVNGEINGACRYQCLNLSGNEVAAGSLSIGSNVVRLAFLPPGIYILRVYSRENVNTGKFIVE